MAKQSESPSSTPIHFSSRLTNNYYCSLCNACGLRFRRKKNKSRRSRSHKQWYRDEINSPSLTSTPPTGSHTTPTLSACTDGTSCSDNIQKRIAIEKTSPSSYRSTINYILNWVSNTVLPFSTTSHSFPPCQGLSPSHQRCTHYALSHHVIYLLDLSKFHSNYKFHPSHRVCVCEREREREWKSNDITVYDTDHMWGIY